MKIQPFKIRVTPEQSEHVQKVLFKNGFNWRWADNKISNIQEPYLYIQNDDGYYITCGDDRWDFEENYLYEKTYDQFVTLYGKPDEPTYRIKPLEWKNNGLYDLACGCTGIYNNKDGVEMFNSFDSKSDILRTMNYGHDDFKSWANEHNQQEMLKYLIPVQ